jgi:hypothetical protein
MQKLKNKNGVPSKLMSLLYYTDSKSYASISNLTGLLFVKHLLDYHRGMVMQQEPE